MSKVLVFKDKSQVTFADGSTIQDCVTVLESFADVDDIRAKFTESNLKGATFDGERLKNIVPVSAKAEAAEDGNVEVHFINREKSHDEIVDEQILEIQAAMAGMV